MLVPVTFILLAESTFTELPLPLPVIASTLAFVANCSVSLPAVNFKVPPSLQIVTLPELPPPLGNDDWSSKTKPVGSINPSTVNLPEILKSTLVPLFSKCAPVLATLTEPSLLKVVGTCSL